MPEDKYIDESELKQVRRSINLRAFGVNPEKFWSYALRSDQCWDWVGPSYGQTSYGYIKNGNGDSVAAHRYAYFLTYGFDPCELHVCHHCDNKACVRPDHLFLGTHLSNMHDMTRKRQQISKSMSLPPDLAKIMKLLSPPPLSDDKTAGGSGNPEHCPVSIRQASKNVTPLIKLPEVARLTGMPLSTLRKSFMRNRPANVPPPPPHKKVGRAVYVMADYLDAWLANLPEPEEKYEARKPKPRYARQAMSLDSNITKRGEAQYRTLVVVDGNRISRTFRTIEEARSWRDDMLCQTGKPVVLNGPSNMTNREN